jgi:hypothetical protein
MHSLFHKGLRSRMMVECEEKSADVCIIHRIIIKNRKDKEKLFNRILTLFQKENGYYKAAAQGKVIVLKVEVSTARGLRGRQASNSSRVTHAPRQEKTTAAAKEAVATTKEGFTTNEESCTTNEESFDTTQEEVVGDTLKFGK